MTTPDASLLRRITLQQGVFTRSDLTSCGHSDAELRSWRASGQVVRATAGAYVVPPTDDEPHARLRELERRRVRAVLLTVGPTYVASHRSALAVLGVPVLDLPSSDEPVHLMQRGPWRRCRRDGVLVHPDTGAEATTSRTVPVADALVQHACLTGLQSGVVSVDAALQAELTTTPLLEAATSRVRGRRGASVLPRLLEACDRRSESPGESLLRLICQDAGIGVTPQVVVRGRGFEARVDLLVDGTDVVLEFDGLLKYRDDAKALANEKRREHQLHRLGLRVVRVTWSDLHDPVALVARIRAAIRAGHGHHSAARSAIVDRAAQN